MWTIPPQPCGAGDRKQLWACWSIIISGTDATEARFGARLSSVQHYSSASAHWQSVSTTLQGPCRSMICLSREPSHGMRQNVDETGCCHQQWLGVSAESLCPFRLPAASILVHNRPFRPFWLKGARSGCSHNQNGAAYACNVQGPGACGGHEVAGLAAEAAQKGRAAGVADGLHPARCWGHCCSRPQLSPGMQSTIFVCSMHCMLSDRNLQHQ